MMSRPTGVCVTLIVIITASSGTSILKPTRPPLSMSTSARTGVSAVSTVDSALPFCCPFFGFAWASAAKPKAIATAANHASLRVAPKRPRPLGAGPHPAKKLRGEFGPVGLTGQRLDSRIGSLFSYGNGFLLVFMGYPFVGEAVDLPPVPAERVTDVRAIRSRSMDGEISPKERTTAPAAAKSLRVRPVLTSPTLAMPAALAAATPAGASSITVHRAGATSRRSAASKKTCGSGLPRLTSSPVTIAPNKSRAPSLSTTSCTFSGGPDDPTASRKADSCRAWSRSTAPGMAGKSSSMIRRKAASLRRSNSAIRASS